VCVKRSLAKELVAVKDVYLLGGRFSVLSGTALGQCALRNGLSVFYHIDR